MLGHSILDFPNKNPTFGLALCGSLCPGDRYTAVECQSPHRDVSQIDLCQHYEMVDKPEIACLQIYVLDEGVKM